MIGRWRRLVAAALDRRLGPLDGRLDALEAQQAALAAEQTAQLEQLAAQLAATAEAVSATQASVAALAPLLRTLAADDPGHRRRLHALRADPGYAVAWDEPDPLVTISIPTRSRPRLLVERSLASALAQTHEHLEVLVVGDAAARRSPPRSRPSAIRASASSTSRTSSFGRTASTGSRRRR